MDAGVGGVGVDVGVGGVGVNVGGARVPAGCGACVGTDAVGGDAVLLGDGAVAGSDVGGGVGASGVATGVVVGKGAGDTVVGVAPALALFAGVGVAVGKTAIDTVVDVAPALASFAGVGAAAAMIGVAGVVGSGGRGSSVAGTAVADDLSSPPGRADSAGSASAPSSVHATTMSNAVASMTIRRPLTNREPRFTRFFADFHILRPSHFKPARKRGVTPSPIRASALVTGRARRTWATACSSAGHARARVGRLSDPQRLA